MLTDADLEDLTEEELAALGADDASICRDDFYTFIREAWSNIESVPFVDNWHIGAMAEHLQAVTLGQIQDLLINVPPGCSKSLTTCVLWPSWEWCRDASVRFFFASYDQKLSTRDSVRHRTLLETPWYKKNWPGQIRFKSNQDQKTYYETEAGGYRLATSIGGHGTGEHPDRIVVDDPHNVRKAESETERQNVIDWWDLTMPTRGLSRNARRVIIMQRLHHRDLSGHVIETGGYVHLCLPMRFEPSRMITTPLGWNDPRKEEGELLTPRQFDEAKLAKVEKSLGAYGIAGQLQQRPQPRGGGLFKPQWFNRRQKAAPRDAIRVRVWDRAATADGGCYTAGVLMAKDKDGTFYVEDCVHGQWEPNERNTRIVATAKRDRARYGPIHEPLIIVERERGSTGLEAFQRLAAQLAGHRVREDAPTGSKDVRAEPWSDQLAAMNVVICDGGQSDGTGKATWDVDSYVQEHLMFKRDAAVKRLGSFKDQVDASSMAFVALTNMQPVGELRVLSFDTSAKLKHPRLVVCDREHLPTILAEQRTMLLEFRQPPPVQEETNIPPPHALTTLLDSLTLTFADINTADYQERWESPVEPYGKPPADLVMTREHGKKIWAWLLKKREPAPEVYFLVDDGTRVAESVAKGIADVLRIPRSTIYFAVAGGDADTVVSGESPAPNGYIYDMTRAARGAVL